MGDEKVFGPEVFRVSFAQAIGHGLLADYRVAVAVVTSAEVARLAAGEAIVSPAGAAVPARMLAAQLALLKAAAQHDLRRIITYHGRVSAAHRFARTLPHAAALLPPGEGPECVHAGSVDGSMRLAERHEILRPLHAPGNQAVVVSNSRVLSEGVDVPELDAVMFADPRDSGTDVVQALGRALRLGTRRSKTATIIIPVMLHEAEAPQAALESSEFAAVWRVVRALRAHDERMATWLDQQRIAYARRDSGRRGPAQPEPGWLSVTGALAGASFAAALQVRIVTAGSSPWLEGYAQAAARHATHGHLLVEATRVTSDGYRLGQWVQQQRSQRKQGILAAERIARLDALAMVWDVHEAAWLHGLGRLRAWHAVHGHAAVPRGYQDPDGFRLGEWVAELRHRRPVLPAGKIETLDALGMSWTAAGYRWQTGLAAARAYQAAHGHLDVPGGYIAAGGLRLDQWIVVVRRKHDRGTLSDAQAAAAAGLGIALGTDRGWARGLHAARAFHAEHGHINVPNGHPPVCGMNLGNWIRFRREQHRDGLLDPTRAAVLEQLGIDWNPGDRAWNDGSAALREFRAKHGHADVPRGFVTPGGYRLGAWLSRKRSLRNSGQLSPERAAELEQLGVRWNPRRTSRPGAPRAAEVTGGPVPARPPAAQGHIRAEQPGGASG